MTHRRSPFELLYHRDRNLYAMTMRVRVMRSQYRRRFGETADRIGKATARDVDDGHCVDKSADTNGVFSVVAPHFNERCGERVVLVGGYGVAGGLIREY